MRVLFLGCQNIPHTIPLMVLDRQLNGKNIETAFIVNRASHSVLKQSGANVLDIDHQNFRTEMQAIGEFLPDVIVDDMSLTTRFTTLLSSIPRIAIQRTGMFRGYRPRNPRHTHSIEFDISQLPDVTYLGIQQPSSLSDLFVAEVKIIPGVPSVEVLPEALRGDPTYHYCGPLLMEDFLIERVEGSGGSALHVDQFRDFGALEDFFKPNRGGKIVYVTFGTIAQAADVVKEAIGELLASGVAVVTNISDDRLGETYKGRYYYAKYLPMHYVCSNVDLMVHQCGSAAYHYPILHNVPAITVGTQRYDREDVAMRLMEKGVSEHVAGPEENGGFLEEFKRAVRRNLESDSQEMRARLARISELNEEIEQTRRAFDFEAVLRQAAEMKKRRSPRHKPVPYRTGPPTGISQVIRP